MATLVGTGVALAGWWVPALKTVFDYAWFVGFGIAFALYVIMMRGTSVKAAATAAAAAVVLAASSGWAAQPPAKKAVTGPKVKAPSAMAGTLGLGPGEIAALRAAGAVGGGAGDP